MPPLSSHFHFAALVVPSLGIPSYVHSFTLGTFAPDAFDPEREGSFSQHHFKVMNERISLEDFRRETNFSLQPDNDSTWSFKCGYYCHLWLDVYYRDNADCLPFRRPLNMSDTDLRSLVRRETEILNAPFVLGVGDLSLPQRKEVVLPVGLEFIDIERCIQLFHEVVKQSLAWSKLVPTFESVDESEYTRFFGDVITLFLNEFQTTA